jgi:hypothetical protein
MASRGSRLVTALRTIEWAGLARLGQAMWKNGRDRVEGNLQPSERDDFRRLLRASRGRPAKLSQRERDDLVHLFKKAATGSGRASWGDVAKALPELLPRDELASFFLSQRGRGRRR